MATDKVMTGADEDRPADKSEDIEIIETDSKGQPIQQADDADEDERLSGDEGESQDSQRAPRKRETHQERRERHRKARERDQREMAFLRGEVVRLGTTVERLGTVATQERVQNLDERLSEALNHAEQAERIEAAAIKANNGEDAVKARRIREEALGKARELHAEKQGMAQPQKPNGQAPAPAFLPHVKKFAEDKPWFNFNPADPDNAVVMALDNQVTAEGYNPNSPDYWAELDRRVKERLPHKFGDSGEDGQDDGDEDAPPAKPRTRKGPPVGAGRTHVPESTRSQVYISPERKQAMIDAGVWDDPVLRQKYVKSYSEWDRNNSARR